MQNGTNPSITPGLEGVVTAETRLSSVNGQVGPFTRKKASFLANRDGQTRRLQNNPAFGLAPIVRSVAIAHPASRKAAFWLPALSDNEYGLARWVIFPYSSIPVNDLPGFCVNARFQK
jgi:hypothetical protein